MATADKVVSIALAEVGYKEKASNADLDLATANAGANNWTKYARDLWEAKYYNGNKNGYPWCDVFVDWCFFKAFGKTEGQLVECQTGDLGAACPYSAGYYKAQGRYDKNPKKGDQVFFQQGGELVHTGIAVEVTATQIVVVEGNSSNMVVKRTYSRSDSYVAGFGHPKYGEVSDGSGGGVIEVTNNAGPEVTVTLDTLQVGSTGSQVKTVQRILYARGIRDNSNRAIAVDGEFGANTKAATVKLQKSLFPKDSSKWTGQFDKDTWIAALTKLW